MSQIIMILLISLLVLVHEAGHYIAARLCGVRVARFGIGMPLGPSWKLFRWQNTDFYIHACLFGGYVAFPDDSMFKEKDEEESSNTCSKTIKKLIDKLEPTVKTCDCPLYKKLKQFQENMEKKWKEKEEIRAEKLKKLKEETEVLPPDSPELYENKTIAQKLFIVSAGVIMNIVFAFILVVFCAMYFQKLPTTSQDIYINGFTTKITSNIESLGLQKNDKILYANDKKIDNIYKLNFMAKNSKLFDDYAQENLIKENTEKLKNLNPCITDVIPKGKNILLPSLQKENPIKVNDNTLIGLDKYKKDGIKLNETQINLRNKIYNKKEYTTTSDTNLNDLAIALSDTYKPLSLTVLRDGKEIKFENIKINQDGLMGIMLRCEDIYLETKTFKDIILKSQDYMYSTTKLMLFSLWQLITGKVNATDMHGVIAVVKVGADIITFKGMLNGILLTAMISINLAIMNFLPIPALDGGHVMFLIIEKITGKKPDEDLAEKINNFFFILLIILMIAICYNDIYALITKKF